MENVANTFRRSLARPKPTIIIPPLPNPFTRTLTPPTTSPPLTPVTPSTPTPTAEFPSGTFRSLNTPKASHVSHNPFEFPEGEEIISVSTHPCEPKDDLGLLTPPLTPPSIQLANLPDCLCPIARCDSRSFGICVGAPVKDILAGSSRSLTGSSRKRKREEQEQWCSSASGNDHETSDQHIIPAHAPKVAPCNDCLDDDESLLWGRCDNKGCWSRCYEPKRNKSKNSKKHSSNADQQVRASPEIALICPDCSPEGGFGCEHRWICDCCASSSCSADGSPLVWECPSCFTPLCSKCPAMSPSCPCSSSIHNPYCIDCIPPPSCTLCTAPLPVCLSAIDPFSSCPGAESTYTSETGPNPIISYSCSSSKSCTNCSSSLCSGCRSALKCSVEGCNAELCQLCPLPDDGLGLDVGSVVCRECEIRLRRSVVSWKDEGAGRFRDIDDNFNFR